MQQQMALVPAQGFQSQIIPYNRSLDVNHNGQVGFEDGLAIGRTVEALTTLDRTMNGQVTRIANTNPLDL